MCAEEGVNSVEPCSGGARSKRFDGEGVLERLIGVDELLFPLSFRDDTPKLPPVRLRERLIGQLWVLSRELAHAFDDGIGVFL
ncbi:hypothetical protein C468_08841 [Halorubrum kocurii JCM 14978]|uniref:Uncharacterized protein n=1 Tax=Halorubrum kocurii JCM 14978 TaxID=1230456 RepID=M0P3E8_9EURY|nr:hypothetical protein C468_08841 [Halorubrum kocurii JCM 14978]